MFWRRIDLELLHAGFDLALYEFSPTGHAGINAIQQLLRDSGIGWFDADERCELALLAAAIKRDDIEIAGIRNEPGSGRERRAIDLAIALTARHA